MNEQEFIFFGIRRGGQHAIINWFASHFKKVHFANDLKDFSKPEVYEDNTGVYELEQIIGPVEGECFWSGDKDVLFQSYEDHPLEGLDFESNASIVGESGRKTCVLIIRDPYNTMASRLRRCDYIFNVDEKAMEMWKKHAREATGKTNFIPNLIVVNYNAWCLSNLYRRRIEVQAGLSVCDSSVTRVSGLGSSFDRRKFDGRAEEMNVMNRWTILEGRPEILKLVRDDETWELAGKLFRGCPELFRPKG